MEEIQTLKQIREDLHNLRKEHMKTIDTDLIDEILEITNKISEKIGYLEAKNEEYANVEFKIEKLKGEKAKKIIEYVEKMKKEENK